MCLFLRVEREQVWWWWNGAPFKRERGQKPIRDGSRQTCHVQLTVFLIAANILHPLNDQASNDIDLSLRWPFTKFSHIPTLNVITYNEFNSFFKSYICYNFRFVTSSFLLKVFLLTKISTNYKRFDVSYSTETRSSSMIIPYSLRSYEVVSSLS